MKIKRFNKGDVVTRFKPAKSHGDRSYIGSDLLFNKVDNGFIFLNRMNDPMFDDKELKLPCDIWSSGWKLVKEAVGIEVVPEYV